MKAKERTLNDDEFRVAPAEVRFAEKMLAIYRPYVTRTAVSFESELPTPNEFK